MAREDVPGLRRQPEPDEVLRGVHRAADRRDGRRRRIRSRRSSRPKFQEVQKYLSLTGHVYTPAYLTVGASASGTALPADVRKILEDTAKETQAYVYETAAKDDDELLAKLKQAGMQVNEVDKDAFIAASKAIYDEFGKEVPGAKALIDRAIALGK